MANTSSEYFRVNTQVFYVFDFKYYHTNRYQIFNLVKYAGYTCQHQNRTIRKYIYTIRRKSMFRVLGIYSGTFQSKLNFPPFCTIFTRLVVAKMNKTKPKLLIIYVSYKLLCTAVMVFVLDNKNSKLAGFFFSKHVRISYTT